MKTFIQIALVTIVVVGILFVGYEMAQATIYKGLTIG